MWDLTEALKFVKLLAPSFGGNPNFITLWGSSAGAALVHGLSESPHSQDLFQRAIQSSGTLFAEWAYSNVSISSSINLASAVGCFSTNETLKSSKIKECLKSKSMFEIFGGVKQVYSKFSSNFRALMFSPIFDNDFFTDKEFVNANSTHIPTLFTVTDAEWAHAGRPHTW